MRLGEIDPAAETFTELTLPQTFMPNAAYELVWDPRPRSINDCLDGCAYLFSTAEVYVWSPDIPGGRTIAAPGINPNAVAWSGTAAYTFGGIDNGLTPQIWRFEPGAEEFLELDETLPANFIPGPIAEGPGGAYIVGWRNFAGQAQQEIWFFDYESEMLEETPWALPAPARFVATFGYGGIIEDTLVVAGGFDERIWTRSLLNDEPTVAVSSSHDSRLTGQSFSFTAAADDPDGTIASIEWSLGDGTTASGAQVTHAYSSPGTYTVSATVRDNEDATATDSLEVTVTAPPPRPPPPPPDNDPPKAVASCSTDFLEVSCDGSKSNDPDGDALTYTWMWGDGSTGTGSKASHTYEAGSYSVQLKVSDGKKSATKTVNVSPTEPQAPVAKFTMSATIITVGSSIALDASTTTQGDGTHSYKWLLNGQQAATGQTATITPDIGSHTIKLVVSTSHAKTSSTQESLTVDAVQEQTKPEPEPDPQPAPQEEVQEADKESPAAFVLPALALALLQRRR